MLIHDSLPLSERSEYIQEATAAARSHREGATKTAQAMHPVAGYAEFVGRQQRLAAVLAEGAEDFTEPEPDGLRHQAHNDRLHPQETPPQQHYPEIHAEHLSTPDARRSRPVSPEEFQVIAARGHRRYQKLIDHKPGIGGTKGLDEHWGDLVEQAHKETRTPWGGMTIEARSGKPVEQGENRYALTVRDPGVEPVSIPADAPKDHFVHAMHEARGRYGHILDRPGHHLGIFHDDDKKSIDFDPVLVTKHHRDVEQIGAYTHAVGGAYNFSDGQGYWPPHVRHSSREASMERQSAARPLSSTLMRAMQARRQAEGAQEVEVAGVAIVAADSGRVLMIQRSNNDESDPARGKLEFPGGHLDEDQEPSWFAARREFEEETGVPFPRHGELVGHWLSPDGMYQGFVYLVPAEGDLKINPDHEDRHVLNPDDPDGDDIEVVLWMDPAEIQRNPAVRDEVRQGTDFKLLKNAADHAAPSEDGEDGQRADPFARGASDAEEGGRRAQAGRGRGFLAGVAGPAPEAGASTGAVRPLTMHPQAVKDLRKLDRREQSGIVSTIDSLRAGDPLVLAQTHRLTGPLSAWYATKSSRGHRVIHQPTADGGLHVGYVGLHEYDRAVKRLGSYIPQEPTP